jgi:hypothetical protein
MIFQIPELTTDDKAVLRLIRAQRISAMKPLMLTLPSEDACLRAQLSPVHTE